jgi:hypothetical protein
MREFKHEKELYFISNDKTEFSASSLSKYMGFLLYFNVSLQYFSSPIPEMCLDLVWSSLRSLFRRQIDTSIISPNEEPLHVFVFL